jgi:psiF repeat
MKRSVWLVSVGAALCMLVSQGVLAQSTASQGNSQQEKMKTCNADAKSKGLSGDDRKTYMKTCLSAAAPEAAKGNSQQEKMKSCNADAKSKGLTGADRKSFMKTCLSGSSS